MVIFARRHNARRGEDGLVAGAGAVTGGCVTAGGRAGGGCGVTAVRAAARAGALSR
jgi:hypothetical protein